MGKIAKQKRKDKRKEQKRARKVANQEHYQALARLGQNKKSKRFIKKSKNKLVNAKVFHPTVCGNGACKECYPRPAVKHGSTVRLRKTLREVK